MSEFTGVDRSKIMELINRKVETGINTTLDDIYSIAYELAPVGKRGVRKKTSVPIGNAKTEHRARVNRKEYTVTAGELFSAFQRSGGGVSRAEFRTLRITAPQRKRVVPAEDFDDPSVAGRKTNRGLIRGRSENNRPHMRDTIEIVPAVVEGHTITGGVRVTARYARYVEFPTRHTAAQPFLLPAFKAARKRLKANIKAAKG